MKNLKEFLFALTAVTFIASCDKSEKDKDILPPEVTVISPASASSTMLGDPIVFKAEFTDNEYLESYGVNINGTEGQTWTFSKTEAFGAKEFDKTIEFSIPTPANTEKNQLGEYKMIVWVKDLDGNADSSIFNISLSAVPPPVFADDFSVGINYLTADLSTTIWNGFLINNGVEAEQNAEVLQANSTANPGTITIETVNTGWEGGHDDGFFLYKNVPGGTNFEVVVEVKGGDYTSFEGAVVDYLTSGLMIKLAGSSDYTCANVFDRPEWGAVVGIRDIYKGEQNDKYDPENKTGAKDSPWLKLVKIGKVVTAYNSADGITWREMGSAEHDEYATENLQVGLSSATFSGNNGIVIFDNFRITYIN
jgi:hypothetical protein